MSKKQKSWEDQGPRMRGPRQGVGLWQKVSPEDHVEEEHPARMIWRLVCDLNWERYEERIQSRLAGGRPALDPRVLAALWVYGIRQGITSARELARRCEDNLVYIWLLGGQRTNHHSLSDFLRVDDVLLEDLMSQVIGCLHRAKAVSFNVLLVDGTKVQARAGAASFYDAAGLEPAVRKKLRALRENNAEEDARVRAADARAKRELLARGEEALAALRQRQAKYNAIGRTRDRERAARLKVSLSDPEARRMRGADGGVQPRVNLQLGVSADTGAVLSVGATAQANDVGLAPAVVRGMGQFCGVFPQHVVTDGGFPNKASIAELAGMGVLLYGPLQRSSRKGAVGSAVRACQDRWAEHGSWARGLRWRVEGVIGQMKGRGLRRIPLFGLAGARRWALWHGLTHNILLWARGR